MHSPLQNCFVCKICRLMLDSIQMHMVEVRHDKERRNVHGPLGAQLDELEKGIFYSRTQLPEFSSQHHS